MIANDLETAPDGTVQLIEPFRRRVHLLRDKLSTMEGYILMTSWTDTLVLHHRFTSRQERPEGYMAEAMVNPCGTACCLAGKAGLMPEFQAEGFRWLARSNGFEIEPDEFFGRTIDAAVFRGVWATRHLRIPQQAVLLLDAFLSDLEQADKRGQGWRPTEDVCLAIYRLEPPHSDWRKRFPVSAKWGNSRPPQT